MADRAAVQAPPKYQKISQDIILGIASGRLAPRSRVPSEKEIMERYGVSNTTARKALLEAEIEGWVQRVKGKGTFVRDERVNRSVGRILGFTQNMRQSGRDPSTRLLNVRRLSRSRTYNQGDRRLVLPGPLYCIERLRLADGEPMMLERRYISSALCPDIDQQDLENSLYAIYERQYGLKLEEVHQTLNAVFLEKQEDLRIFGLQEAVPAFLVEGATFCVKNRLLEMEESLYRGDRYRFDLTAR